MAKEPTTLSIEDIWRKYDSVEQRLSAPLSERMLDLGNLRQGSHVLDLATGRGEPAIPAAKRVSPGGKVIGVDIDSTMLRIARENADRDGVTNLELAVADVETLDNIPQNFFNVAFSRWGLMYLQRPVRALQATRNALASDGLFVAAVWINPDQASFFELPRAALSKVMTVPPVDHDLPGTFYYSGLDRLANDLDAAGFELDQSETREVDVIEVASNDELIAWARAFGMSRMLQHASSEQQAAWEDELVKAAVPYRSAEGSIRLGGTCRIVVAS